MRRRGRNFLSDLFYNTGDLNERTVDDSFGFSRQFADTVTEGMLEDERIKRARLKREQERAAHPQVPPVDSTAEESPTH
ncbi:hypothetical protein CLV24_11387 [Pontibacter ummariensis]|uniref:Uncharacterized protein n=1 Tax=Pontibacter ummariensis TaxID=1610492 RepID=A0A239HEF0_9BACT|nr:hypothetical protein [Pontibacter ummariensis]PRY10668.1 hypothetical protein CLV24_11387 [Pontibacter ummariensis]SNS78634.1 hypothetical protein SAMN06296052_11368 [Pontibacter ummariensis]